jgi:hypothetical protein
MHEVYDDATAFVVVGCHEDKDASTDSVKVEFEKASQGPPLAAFVIVGGCTALDSAECASDDHLGVSLDSYGVAVVPLGHTERQWWVNTH